MTLHCRAIVKENISQEKWWPSANPRSASLELCPSQASIQDVDAEAYHQMHSVAGLVWSVQPEGCLLPRHRPFLWYAFEGRA